MSVEDGTPEVAVGTKRVDIVSFLAKYGVVLSLGTLIIVFSIARPDVFPTVGNFLSIMNQISILGMIALGLTVCLVMGLFDLSIGAMATLGGYAAARVLAQDLSDPGAIDVVWVVVLVLSMAAIIGMMNGVLVSYLGISAFIETLAAGSIITGAILGVSASRTVLRGIPPEFLVIGQEKLVGIPNPVVIMLGLGFMLWVFLEHTQPGRSMYAIGGNPEAARPAGIAVKRYALVALGICAACAALGGLVAAANLGAGRPQGVGGAYLRNAFAAVFIGASTLRPGQFHILGTLIGVILIGVINNGLSIMGIPTFWRYIVQGILLIMALFAAGVLQVRRG